MKEVVRRFTLSNEYLNRFVHGHTPQHVVEELYRVLLDRPADPEGLNHWNATFVSQGFPTVVGGIIDSPEYASKWGDGGVPGLSVVASASYLSVDIPWVVVKEFFRATPTVDDSTEMRHREELVRERDDRELLEYIERQVNERGEHIA